MLQIFCWKYDRIILYLRVKFKLPIFITFNVTAVGGIRKEMSTNINVLLFMSLDLSFHPLCFPLLFGSFLYILVATRL